MEDFTICPKCTLWKENLRVVPCCGFKFCEDCIHKYNGCVRCGSRLNFELLPIYKPTNVLMKQCLVACMHCGIMKTNLLIKTHQDECKKAPVPQLEVDMDEELRNIKRNPLTQNDAQTYHIRKNLLASYHKSLPSSIRPSLSSTPGGTESYTTHIVMDTETLAGISLRYGVNIEALKRINNITGDGAQALHGRSVLKVPSSSSTSTSANAEPSADGMVMEESMEMVLKRRLATRFSNATGCKNTQEIAYYLESAQYNFDEAVEEYKADNAWAESKIQAKSQQHQHQQGVSAGMEKRCREELAVEKVDKVNRRCCFSVL
eukprot:TRINITY_DN2809_c0_g1_i1.p1 TRINITY_DN2809_c0_g1~~TRINITY_DN2809_c0_g1_i1.p1  ORF type:complete len:318 (+),score=73.83 TRINITY_DN2809_c0_g1_i1:88-1041(+)